MLKSSILRRLAEKIIYCLNGKTADRIMTYIAGKSVVSFDVFDTLVIRDVTDPEDVFAIMEKRLTINGRTDVQGFAKTRKQAEMMARKRHPGREVTLRDIYEWLPYDPSVKEELMLFENQTEVSVSAQNIPMKRVYDACVEQGKRILFISDMYLSADIIQNALNKNGYSKGRLYVSSETGYTKYSGELFSYVQKQEKIDVHQWIHIGDAVKADYFIPKKIGICALLLKRNVQYNRCIDKRLYKENQGYRQLLHFINLRITNYPDFYSQIGYSVLGPLLYGFSAWLEKEIPQNNTIAFITREGRLLKKAFEIVSERSAVYFRISRQAANIAYLSKSESVDDVIRNGVRPTKLFATQKQLAKSCGLADEDIKALFAENGLHETDIIFNTAMEQRLLETLWPMIRIRTEGQNELLGHYIKQLGITSKCALVDVGWRGTVQAILERLAYSVGNDAIQWNGFYLGILSDNYSTKNKKQGFLFDEKNSNRIEDSIRGSFQIFELLFQSLEGMSEKYAEADCGMVVSVSGVTENIGNTAEMIHSIQKAGIQFVKDFCGSSASVLIDLDAEVSAGNYIALAHVPSMDTLRYFESICAYDGSVLKLTSEHSFWYYLINFRQFVRDFAGSGCKTWFLKSVFRIPLPYTILVNMVRKMVTWKGRTIGGN